MCETQTASTPPQWADIATIEMALYLIMLGFHDGGGTISTLVNVLMNVLDCFDRPAHLHIDMCLVPKGEIWAAGNYPLIVNDSHNIPFGSPHCDAKALTRIPPPIEGIAILRDDSLRLELTGKALTAGLSGKWIEALHAEGLAITTHTVSVHHCPLNNTSQLLTHRISACWNFSTDKAINISRSQERLVSLQKHQEV